MLGSVDAVDVAGLDQNNKRADGAVNKTSATDVETEFLDATDTVDESLSRLGKLVAQGLITAKDAKIWRIEFLGLPASVD